MLSAVLVFSACFATPAQLPFPIPFLGKKAPAPSGPSLPVGGRPSRAFSKLDAELDGLMHPKADGPDLIDMYFQGPQSGIFRIGRPGPEWEMHGPERRLDPTRPSWRVSFAKGGAVIDIVIVLDGGADAYDLAERETTLLRTSNEALVARPVRTLYENTDGVLIHRADMRCSAFGGIGPEPIAGLGRSCPTAPDRDVDFVFATFHEPRSVLAYAPYTACIRAEYPRKQKKEVGKAIFLMTGYARISYER